jgi:SAM-dependent methyltransferase
MHVVEHIGLGRYGDPVDPAADLRAMAELKRVLAPGGSLLFVVPIGRPRIMFNAHRIYSYDQISDYFAGLELKEFALIPDSSNNGGLIRDAKKVQANEQRYGCGCFWFKKALNCEVA